MRTLPRCPSENEEAGQGYFRDAIRAGHDGGSARRHVRDVLRMDVIDHVDGWPGDATLRAEYEELSVRTRLPTLDRASNEDLLYAYADVG